MVLHAQPARMFAQVSFISDFLGDADLIELTGFYLTSLTVCTCRLMVLAASSPTRQGAVTTSPCTPTFLHVRVKASSMSPNNKINSNNKQ